MVHDVINYIITSERGVKSDGVVRLYRFFVNIVGIYLTFGNPSTKKQGYWCKPVKGPCVDTRNIKFPVGD